MLQWFKLLIFLAPIFTFLAEEVRMKWAIDAAVKAEAEKQIKIADGRVAALQADFWKNAFNTVVVVTEGENSVTPTPADKAERQKVCDADPMCRDRRKKK